ncbi:hypothetical protein [Limnoglobus roseus]|uniref:Uncharacterized protein n=1 Tax=Limnoglobus roseus TaxID=2598579 RepID=A0A5C1AIC9_9BACT|nr:hypothetical protein [Limnoglobus roseus]QEL18013.1 hypothetical protein PX52LOC_05027 [Limnoglobus roseus]
MNRLFPFVAIVLSLPLLSVFAIDPGSDPSNPAIFLSAWLAMIGWYVGATAVLARGAGAARLWAVGCGLQILHVAIAFHATHGWSHAAAFEHTRQVGGIGEGVYVNYLFTAVWLLDATWLCLAPRRYARRPRWLTVAVHGFLLFIVFNAMAVFGSWVARGLFGGFVMGVLKTRFLPRCCQR